MELKEIYKKKDILQKRIYNMLKKFEKDTNLYVTGFNFFDKNDPNEEKLNNYEYTDIFINTVLYNNKEKIKS
jgi:hypothetical protein